MRDCPYSPDSDPQYLEHVMAPLANGEGVACFLADGDNGQAVLFFSHSLTGRAAAWSTDGRDRVRAAQAIAVQRRAREKARDEGFEAVVA